MILTSVAGGHGGEGGGGGTTQTGGLGPPPPFFLFGSSRGLLFQDSWRYLVCCITSGMAPFCNTQ